MDTRRNPAAVKTAVLTHAAGEAADARDKAQQRRRVSVTPDADGMAWISACIRDLDAHRIYHRLTAAGAAHKADHPSDDRDADQRRADLFVALLLGHGTNPDHSDSGDAGDGCTDDKADPVSALARATRNRTTPVSRIPTLAVTSAVKATRTPRPMPSIKSARAPTPARPSRAAGSAGARTMATRRPGSAPDRSATSPTRRPRRDHPRHPAHRTGRHPAEVSGMGPIPADLARENWPPTDAGGCSSPTLRLVGW